jgi:AcrR family transcriptional regulator
MATRAGLDRAAVIQAAATLADSVGLEGITLAMLANHLGVRTPTLYHYVAGLDGLRRELALLGIHEAETRLGRAVMGKAGDDAVVALTSAYRAFAKERPGLYAATTYAPDPDDAEWQKAGAAVVDIVLRALAAYHMPQDEALHAVRAIRSIVHGLVSLENSGGFGLPLAVDETFRRLVRMLLDYLHHEQKSNDPR